MSDLNPYEQSLANDLALAKLIIDAFIEDEGYIPKRVQHHYDKLFPYEWDGDTWREPDE